MLLFCLYIVIEVIKKIKTVTIDEAPVYCYTGNTKQSGIMFLFIGEAAARKAGAEFTGHRQAPAR